MSGVRIHLDDPHAFYTNLDFISGKVILSLASEENVSAILVKLEGESKTMLLRAAREYDRREKDTVASETHKILYKVQQVFPSNDPSLGLVSASAYTLPAGQHEYPFRLKLPFNNSCANSTQGFGFAGIRLMDLPPHLQYKHVTKTLPPSLSGFPGEAEIRYYIKVTVQRPSIWKGNRRNQVGFKFLPIEPIRPPRSNAEIFARRPHTFKSGLAPYARKSSMFKKSPTPLSTSPPSVLVDARLPSPAILTCNEPIPLRLIIKKQAESPEYVFLMALQIELIGDTHVRAQDVHRTETRTWVIGSLSGLSIPVGKPSDKTGTETVVDSKLWDQTPLPHTVTPSFDACNLTRSYQLDVKVTIGYGHPGQIQPQTQLLPLRFDVQVYSGIAPSPALLNAMASRPTPASNRPTRPLSANTPPTFDPVYPPQLGTPGATSADDAPPSYEDAMADDIGPVDGPRREYSGVTNENAPSEVDDENVARNSARAGKKGDSDRLFPNAGPGPRPGSGNGYIV